MIEKIKKLSKSKKGAADYFEMCIAIVVLTFVVIFTLNIYEFYTLRDDMNEIAETLVEYAATTGSLGADFEELVNTEREIYPKINFTVGYDSDILWNHEKKTVTRGQMITIRISTTNSLKGLGLANSIQIPCSVVKRATCTGSDLSNSSKG